MSEQAPKSSFMERVKGRAKEALDRANESSAAVVSDLQKRAEDRLMQASIKVHGAERAKQIAAEDDASKKRIGQRASEATQSFRERAKATIDRVADTVERAIETGAKITGGMRVAAEVVRSAAEDSASYTEEKVIQGATEIAAIPGRVADSVGRAGRFYIDRITESAKRNKERMIDLGERAKNYGVSLVNRAQSYVETKKQEMAERVAEREFQRQTMATEIKISTLQEKIIANEEAMKQIQRNQEAIKETLKLLLEQQSESFENATNSQFKSVASAAMAVKARETGVELK